MLPIEIPKISFSYVIKNGQKLPLFYALRNKITELNCIFFCFQYLVVIRFPGV
jgi:hypothetical protein